LKTMTDTLGGHFEASLAAYNAGLSRAHSWLSWGEFREPAEFIETVPFAETRNYFRPFCATPTCIAGCTADRKRARHVKYSNGLYCRKISPPTRRYSEPAREIPQQRTMGFTESVIREMSRLAAQHNAVNLAQGFPDFPAPEILKAAAQQAIADNINQYAITWGSKPLRDAITAKYKRTTIWTSIRARNHGLLRIHRRHDGGADGDHQSRRRSGHLRAVLRKLRPRYAAERRRSQIRQDARARLTFDRE